MSARLLPDPFGDLEEMATEWALATEVERTRRRYASSLEQLQAVYSAILPRLESIFSYLDRYPLDELPADAQRLFYLTLSLAEIAPAVEAFKDPQVIAGPEGATLPQRFVPLPED